jgi:uncharacterized protein involved in response to NO
VLGDRGTGSGGGAAQRHHHRKSLAPHSGHRHVLAIGGFGLPILPVLAIAGRAHVGSLPWPGAGFVLAVLALLGAALARAAWAGGWSLGLGGSMLLWLAAWGWVAWRLAPAWWRERCDGSRGCAGPDDAGC